MIETMESSSSPSANGKLASQERRGHSTAWPGVAGGEWDPEVYEFYNMTVTELSAISSPDRQDSRAINSEGAHRYQRVARGHHRDLRRSARHPSPIALSRQSYARLPTRSNAHGPTIAYFPSYDLATVSPTSAGFTETTTQNNVNRHRHKLCVFSSTISPSRLVFAHRSRGDKNRRPRRGRRATPGSFATKKRSNLLMSQEAHCASTYAPMPAPSSRRLFKEPIMAEAIQHRLKGHIRREASSQTSVA